MKNKFLILNQRLPIDNSMTPFETISTFGNKKSTYLKNSINILTK